MCWFVVRLLCCCVLLGLLFTLNSVVHCWCYGGCLLAARFFVVWGVAVGWLVLLAGVVHLFGLVVTWLVVLVGIICWVGCIWWFAVISGHVALGLVDLMSCVYAFKFGLVTVVAGLVVLFVNSVVLAVALVFV